MKAHVFSINFSYTIKSTGWKEGAGKNFEFLKIFFPEITLWNVTITSFA